MMKQSTAATLSGHLLGEAGKFLLYPQKVRRSRRNSEAQRIQESVDA
jgi:hypothetical protein